MTGNADVALPAGDVVVPVEQLLSTLRGGILEVNARTKYAARSALSVRLLGHEMLRDTDQVFLVLGDPLLRFVDETLRITRTGERENQIFVFTRSG